MDRIHNPRFDPLRLPVLGDRVLEEAKRRRGRKVHPAFWKRVQDFSRAVMKLRNGERKSFFRLAHGSAANIDNTDKGLWFRFATEKDEDRFDHVRSYADRSHRDLINDLIELDGMVKKGGDTHRVRESKIYEQYRKEIYVVVFSLIFLLDGIRLRRWLSNERP